MNASPFKTAANFGALEGLTLFGMFLLLMAMGFNPLGQASLLAIWVPVVFIIWATRQFRDRELGGYISYGQAFLTGMMTSFLGAILYVLMIYIYYKVFNNTFFEEYKETMLKQMEMAEELTRSMFGDAFYDAGYEEMKNSTLPATLQGEVFTKSLFGVIVSLITAAFLKRKAQNIL